MSSGILSTCFYLLKTADILGYTVHKKIKSTNQQKNDITFKNPQNKIYERKLKTRKQIKEIIQKSSIEAMQIKEDIILALLKFADTEIILSVSIYVKYVVNWPNFGKKNCIYQKS